ncbi:MAG: hypothetical protein HYW57_06510 [Ignavibacteriales bacterium]|nr:hypothetical protein [Ignavibacteriales bacterium]
MGDQKADTVELVYRFKFENGPEKDFVVQLDSDSYELILSEHRPRPEWTKLKYHQCENCPLDDSVEYCPVAVNLASLVESFQDSISFEKTKVTVDTQERTFVKETTLQKGLSALIGIYMVTSNCPVMDKLRPMVQFHLPFATSRETVYRAVTMYLTAQFFIMRRGGKPDWELKGLSEIYKAISAVNRGISGRISNASTKDANVNAVVILHSVGESLPYVIENGLNEIEALFTHYLKQIEELSDSS